MKAPIWVTLPNLPFDLWHQKVFEGIGNSFGKFITTYEVTKAQSRMLEVRFYVMVEFGVKFPTSITLEAETGEIEQELKYETNNCLCSLCNQVGHIMCVCSKRVLKNKKEWKPKLPQENSNLEEDIEDEDQEEEGEINQGEQREETSDEETRGDEEENKSDSIQNINTKGTKELQENQQVSVEWQIVKGKRG